MSKGATAIAPGDTQSRPLTEYAQIASRLAPEGTAERTRQPSFSDETVSLGEAEAMALSQQALENAKGTSEPEEEVTPLSSARHAPPEPEFDSPEEATRVVDSSPLASSPLAGGSDPTNSNDPAGFSDDEATRVFDAEANSGVTSSDLHGDDDEATRVFDAEGGQSDDEATRVYDPEAGASAPQPAAPAPSTGSAPPAPASRRGPTSQPAVPRRSAPPARLSSVHEDTQAGRGSQRLSRPPSATQNVALGLFLFVVSCVVAATIVYLVDRPTFDRAKAWLTARLGITEAPQSLAEGPEFSTDAAAAVLGEAAKGANECKKPDGPSGRGRARILYQPDGRATSAAVSPPFHDTPTGECLIGLFTETQVPPFGGSPVIVTKTFEIE